MPSQHQLILASLPFTSLDDLAATADKISDATTPSSYCIAAVSSTNDITNKFDAKLDIITAEIALLKANVEHFRNGNSHFSLRSRSNSKSRHSRSHSRRNSKNQNKSSLC